jgi:formylglycine-generating enzyme required for sulfatase activity
MVTSLSSRGGSGAAPALLSLIALGGLAAGYWYLSQKNTAGPPAAGENAGENNAAAVAAVETIANSLGMKFAPIPKGKFLMGSPKTEAQRGDDEEQHEVTITKSFHIAIHEVTQGQYEKIMNANPSFFTPTGPGKAKVRTKDTSQHPVECVSWHQAVEFCKKLEELDGEKAGKRRYRLPTEAEWEYACRAGTTTALHLGDAVDSYSANFNGLSPYGSGRGGPFHRVPWQVGAYPANKFGLYDMHGNVMEWCQDWYAADYYAKSPKEDPPGPAEGTEKVTRGGSWSNSGKACRSAVRTKLAPEDSHYGLGFRVVMEIGG